MALVGKQKAAMLLMSLDAATVTELLKGLDAREIQEIAMELAQINSSKQHNAKEQAKIIQEFCNLIQEKQTRFNMRSFLDEMLVKVLDKDKVEQIQSQIKKATEKKDLFMDIRSAGTEELVLALEDQHPQTIALVLSELPPKKSQEVLSILNEESRLKAVCKMTSPDVLAAGVKRRMASMVSERLRSFKGEATVARPGRHEQNLRKLAVVLSGLEKDLRDQLLGEISKHDEETGTKVKALMVTWEDITSIADRSLQESLRTVESSKLAVALYGADEEIAKKIRSNISERAVAILDEEASLMQEPLEKEVFDAREEVVKPLREANEAGTLRMVGR
jgi:flagellar motor switch protein FliG